MPDFAREERASRSFRLSKSPSQKRAATRGGERGSNRSRVASQSMEDARRITFGLLVCVGTQIVIVRVSAVDGQRSVSNRFLGDPEQQRQVPEPGQIVRLPVEQRMGGPVSAELSEARQSAFFSGFRKSSLESPVRKLSIAVRQ